jgi:hypothetical protein
LNWWKSLNHVHDLISYEAIQLIELVRLCEWIWRCDAMWMDGINWTAFMVSSHVNWSNWFKSLNEFNDFTECELMWMKDWIQPCDVISNEMGNLKKLIERVKRFHLMWTHWRCAAVSSQGKLSGWGKLVGLIERVRQCGLMLEIVLIAWAQRCHVIWTDWTAWTLSGVSSHPKSLVGVNWCNCLDWWDWLSAISPGIRWRELRVIRRDIRHSVSEFNFAVSLEDEVLRWKMHFPAELAFNQASAHLSSDGFSALLRRG